MNLFDRALEAAARTIEERRVAEAKRKSDEMERVVVLSEAMNRIPKLIESLRKMHAPFDSYMDRASLVEIYQDSAPSFRRGVILAEFRDVEVQYSMMHNRELEVGIRIGIAMISDPVGLPPDICTVSYEHLQVFGHQWVWKPRYLDRLDVRNTIMALSDEYEVMKTLFLHRFPGDIGPPSP